MGNHLEPGPLPGPAPLRRLVLLILAAALGSGAHAQRPAGIAERAAGAVVEAPAEPAFSGADYVLRIPATLDNVHPDIAAARVECLITDDAGVLLASPQTQVPLNEDGGFDGTVVVPVLLESRVAGASRYQCTLRLSEDGERFSKPFAEHHRDTMRAAPGYPYAATVRGGL